MLPLAGQMSIRAALFDIDGTLVDSNYLHVDAWSSAFADVHVGVDAWRIHRCIGMDSQKLLDALLPDSDESTRERAKDAHDKHYQSSSRRLRAFERARDLVRELGDRGLTLVLATSAPEHELKNLRKVLDLEEAVDVVTSSEDVDTAKPAPDIVQVALSRTKVSAAEAIMVGDSVWDVKAAGAAGVACIALLSGGTSADELKSAGAAAVYADPAELLAELESSPLFT